MKQYINNLTRLLGGEKALGFINRSSDIILALFMVILIMMIIIPIPPSVIDGLITINLTIYHVAFNLRKGSRLDLHTVIVTYSLRLLVFDAVSDKRRLSLLHSGSGSGRGLGVGLGSPNVGFGEPRPMDTTEDSRDGRGRVRS